MDLVKKLELEAKQIKYIAYKIAWYMRGAISYDDIMYKLSADDKEVISTIISENIEQTAKTRLPFI